MTLPALDQAYLEERGIAYETHVEGGVICVVLTSRGLPEGFTVATADVLFKVVPGYPDIAPDMWWVSPEILRSDGTAIPGTEVREQLLGRTWQRWSRHFQAGQWQSGVDGLESFVALMRSEFALAAHGLAV